MIELKAVEIEPGEDIIAALMQVGEYGFVRLKPGSYYIKGFLELGHGQGIIGRRFGPQALALVFADGVKINGNNCVFLNVTVIRPDGTPLEMVKEGV
ncbi:MAG: hypothetical protein M0R06_07440 [Sphaerochaeta sp.]|nr:hypothetical protein [Sphaerochaeta sp.]